MPTRPDQFREKFYQSTWIFDVFAHGFDFLNGRFYPTPDSGLEQRWETEQEKLKEIQIADEIIRADGTIPPALTRYLDIPGGDAEMEASQFCLRLFSILTVIDRAAGDMNYLGASSNFKCGRWARTMDYFERYNKQLQQRAPGYVVFKSTYFKDGSSAAWLNSAVRDNARWKKIPPRGEDLSNYFQNLLRLSVPEDCELDFRILSPFQDFHDLNWDKLRLGFVPLVEQLEVRESAAHLKPGPLILKKESNKPSTFGIQVENDDNGQCSDLCKRAEAGLRYLAKKGCQIVLFPEMVVPDPVVDHLKKVLSELALLDLPRPGLVLAGTFTRFVQRYSSAQPFNVAIVLNHLGEELWRQRKMHPYDMQRHEQQRFGLEILLNSDYCRENIAFNNRKLRLVDSPATGLRMMVLICEDATRDPGLHAVRELQPGLVLAPVMAGPLEPTSGFGDSVSQASQHAASIFIVSNSAALARAAWGTRIESVPLAIVGLPLLNVLEKYRPMAVVRDREDVPGSPGLQVLIYEFPT